MPLHPYVDRREDVSRFSRNRPCRANATRTEEACRKSALVFRHGRSRSLLSERLTQMLRRQTHFLSEIEQLILAELLDRVSRAALQLGGARQDSLERGSIETRSWKIGFR